MPIFEKNIFMKNFTLLVFALFGALFASAQTQNVTFQVDMSNYTGTYTTVYVNATFNGWCGSCNPMTDANNDDVWEVTLPLTPGAIEFKYTLDGWTAQETLAQSLPCTKMVAVNNNRDITVPSSSDTTLAVVCWESCGPCGAALNQIDLPIDWEGSTTDYTVLDFGGNASAVVVDPTDPTNMVLQSTKTAGAQTWAGTSLSSASGLANAVALSATENIITANVWSSVAGVEVQLKLEDNTDPTKSVETLGNATTVVGWQSMTFDFSTQRPGTAPVDYSYTYDKLSVFYDFDVVGGANPVDYYIDDIVFGSGGTNSSNVTFQLDMNNYSGAFTTPEVNGLFNGWCGNCIPMTDADMDGIWEVTVPITDDSTEYKFSFDNWTGQESLLPGLACTKTTGANTNRFVTLSGDTTLPAVCWEACGPCSSGPVSAAVTFMVDLSEYTGAYTDVNINGTFNGWCGGCNPMTSPNNDGIYEVTLTVPTDSIEYKFTLDGWTEQETLTEGLPCTVTKTDASGTFTNRVLIPSNDTTLAAVCWESCALCGTVGIEESEWLSDLKVSPNPSNGIINISANFKQVENYSINVLDLSGRTIYTENISGNKIDKTINLSNVEGGMYILNIVNEEMVVSKRIMIAE